MRILIQLGARVEVLAATRVVDEGRVDGETRRAPDGRERQPAVDEVRRRGRLSRYLPPGQRRIVIMTGWGEEPGDRRERSAMSGELSTAAFPPDSCMAARRHKRSQHCDDQPHPPRIKSTCRRHGQSQLATGALLADRVGELATDLSYLYICAWFD